MDSEDDYLKKALALLNRMLNEEDREVHTHTGGATLVRGLREAEFQQQIEGFDKHEMMFVGVTEKEFKESDERGKKVVAVKGFVVAKVLMPPMKFKG